MFVVRGEGPFADAVRRALEYAQSRGVDLSGVEVEVVPDPSITDAGAYTEHHGGLRFRIRYNPRSASDPVLASHEAGHVAYWTWQNKKRGGVQYVPDVDEPLAEAFGSVTARQLFGWPVTFKGAPLNLTQVLPARTTYITTTVDGKPVVVKVPEWGDYKSRYKAGIFLSPYFYNVTNWSHVFGNVTAMPGDVIETIHKAWKEGAVETVPGWGAVWRTTPTWSWTDTDTSPQRKSAEPAESNTQKANASDAKTTPTDTVATTTSTSSTPPGKEQNTSAVVTAQPSADVPLPPSNVQPPKYFSTDITPRYNEVPEWSSYISGRRVLAVFRNWPFLDTATLKETRKDHVAGVGVVSGDRLRFESKIPVPRVVDPNAWIELVDEKTGKVLARLRSDELYKLTNEGAPLTLYWSHVATEEKWPGWERFLDRAKELDEKLGVWRPSGGAVSPPPGSQQTSTRGVASNIPDGTVKVANAPTEYVSPKVPDDVRRQFEDLLSSLKKLGEGVNLKNVGEVHDKFIQLRDKALDIARAYPQLVDEINKAVGEVGSAIRETSDKLYSALAKAAGRDSFWKGEGDVKTPIGVYKYDPATGAFLLALYDRPTAENIVGYIKDGGTPVVVKKTPNMSEALEEYNKIASKAPSGEHVAVQTGGGPKPPPLPVVVQATSQAGSSQQTDFLSGVANFLTNALKTGAGAALTILGGARQTPADDSRSIQRSSGQQFVEVKPQSESRAVYNRRRGMPTLSSEFVQPPPSRQQNTEEFVAVRPSRPLDYVLAEEEARRGSEKTATSSSGYRPADQLVEQQSSGSSAPSLSNTFVSRQSSSLVGYRPVDYLVSQQSSSQQSSSDRDYTKGRGLWGASSNPQPESSSPQVAETSQSSSGTKRHRGRPVAVPI
jgi:hypothetical protein